MSKTGNQRYQNYSCNNNSTMYDHQATNEVAAGCICDRSPKCVLCPECGYNFQGRVRQTCAWHPNVVHLMDLGACPKCKANCLREIEPHRKSRNSMSSSSLSLQKQ
ncbi:hypothetical protein Ahia01_000635200 [Argonauta hians]